MKMTVDGITSRQFYDQIRAETTGVMTSRRMFALLDDVNVNYGVDAGVLLGADEKGNAVYSRWDDSVWNTECREDLSWWDPITGQWLVLEFNPDYRF